MLKLIELRVTSALVVVVSVASPAFGSQPAPVATEESRVSAFLDSIYRAQDVRHTFTSGLGDTVDCVDFAAEPAVRTLLAQGATIDQLTGDPMLPPELAALVAAGGPTGEGYFDGDPDDLGRARVCPPGTTTHIRVTSTAIEQAGGLDAYLASGLHTLAAAPTASPGAGVGHAWTQMTWGPLTASQGGQSVLAIAKPGVPTGTCLPGYCPAYGAANTQDFSLSQTWTLAATASGLRQTVEAGWVVDSQVTSDRNPHFFIFSTADDYANGCWNNVICSGTGVAPTWIPWSGGGGVFAPNMTLPYSTPGGTQNELTVYTQRNYYGDWYVLAAINGGAVQYAGHYTYASYGPGTYPPSQGLQTGATTFQAGSEVFDWNPTFDVPANVAMGESPIVVGHSGVYGTNSYIRDCGYYNNAGYLEYSGATSSVTEMECNNFYGTCVPYYNDGVYVADTTGAAKAGAGWINWYYYGDFATTGE